MPSSIRHFSLIFYNLQTICIFFVIFVYGIDMLKIAALILKMDPAISSLLEPKMQLNFVI